MRLQAGPKTKGFNQKALKPAAKAVADNAEQYADQANEQMIKAAAAVSEKAVPVTDDATENYLKPAAEACFLIPRPFRTRKTAIPASPVALRDWCMEIH